MPDTSSWRQLLVIMVKEPRPGRVKTRLAAGIGSTAAAWWFRHQTNRLIRDLSGDRRWQTILAVSPDVEGLTSRVWPAQIERWPQGPGNLGDRMRRVFTAKRAGSMVIIGADIPDITPSRVDAAFTALGRSDAVLGPSTDGGYWLIGLKRQKPVPPRMFEGVRWSTEHARADTLASLGDLSVDLIDTLSDVDTVDDLRRSADGSHKNGGSE